ncbi:MAG: TIGR04255 family protein [Proteobacteria bacterium]|nr:TIGR04255 family protein [Pseudomonadota bacterium]
MTVEPLTLHNPPIVEAVLDIECDFASSQSIADLEKQAAEKLRDRYPKSRRQFTQQFIMEFSASPPAESDMPVPSVSALQFAHDDGKQLIQFRDTGYSFNRLAPYRSLDEYLPEIQRTWDIFRELFVPILIRMVRLRYINRLKLPLDKSKIELNEYLKVGPRLPDEDSQSLFGFLNQHQMFEKETGHLITTVLMAEEVKDDKLLPVIFDNMVAAPVDTDPADWPKIEATIQSLRDLKNKVFSGTLTEKCLHLYR